MLDGVQRHEQPASMGVIGMPGMRSGLILTTLIAVFSTTEALADCVVSSDSAVVTRTLDPSSKEDADVVVSMSMMPMLMHIAYASAGKKPACDLGAFTADAKSYELFGDEKAGRQRKAIPSTKGDPIAEIVPVTNILKAIEASKQGKTVPVEGYLLATITKAEFTGWRFYTGMPDQDVLKRDMAEALGGGGTPIFRNGTDGKTTLFVPKG